MNKDWIKSAGLTDCIWPPDCGRDPQHVATDLAVRLANAWGIEDDSYRVSTGLDKPFHINFVDAMMAQLESGQMSFADHSISAVETTFVGGRRR